MGAYPNSLGKQLLELVAACDAPALRAILEAHPRTELDFGYGTPFDTLYREPRPLEHKIETVAALVAAGFSLEAPHPVLEYPFIVSVIKERDFAFARHLLQTGVKADFPQSAWNAFLESRNMADSLEDIQSCGFEPDKIRQALFWNAIKFLSVELASHCIAEGLPLTEMRTPYGWPVLCQVCTHTVGSSVSMLELLLEAAPELRDQACPDGRTPLMIAVANGNVPAAAFLLDRGADPDARDTRSRGLGDVVDFNRTAMEAFLNQRGLACFPAPEIAFHRMIIEAREGRIQVDFSPDDPEWDELYCSAESITGEEPSEEKRDGYLLCTIRSNQPLTRILDVIENEAGLVSEETLDRLRAAELVPRDA